MPSLQPWVVLSGVTQLLQGGMGLALVGLCWAWRKEWTKQAVDRRLLDGMTKRNPGLRKIRRRFVGVQMMRKLEAIAAKSRRRG